MKSKFSLMFGLLLILVAVIFILSSVGIINAQYQKIIVSWQMLIVFFGVLSLLTRYYINAAIFLVVGSYFLIPHIFSIYGFQIPVEKTNFTNIFIALSLIVTAIAIIYGGTKIKKVSRSFFDIEINKNGLPHVSCAFGKIDHTVIEKPFKGVYVNTAFGEMTVNMGNTTLPDGDSYLNVYTAFGKTTLLIPKSWNVQVLLDSAFGSINNEIEGLSPESNSRLIIRGGVSFGEIEIKTQNLGQELFTENNENKEDAIENISVKHNNRVYIITLEELQYIQADGDYVTLYTSQGKFLKEQTMKYFQLNLPAERFIRIHRSYIVNISEINSVDCRGKEIYYVMLKDGSSLRASSTGYQMLKEKLEI